MKIQFFLGGGVGSGEIIQRSKVLMKIQKKMVGAGFGFENSQKKSGGGGWGRGVRVGGVRVDVNEELKFL